MTLLNHDTLLVFGGIKGTIVKYDIMYNDVFLYNIPESIWVEPVIGGIQPSPRIGFSLCCNYDHDKMEVLILGGYTNDNDGYVDKTKNFVKMYVITENDPNSRHFWNIRDINYKEEQNDEHFLLTAEKTIYEYKEKINNMIAKNKYWVALQEVKKIGDITNYCSKNIIKKKCWITRARPNA